MGAWGVKTFENDDACDWLYALEESNDLTILEETLDIEEEYLEAPEGCNVLAAAEIVLALLGKQRSGLPENGATWIKENSGLDASTLKDKTIKAVSMVLSEESELVELWEETEDFISWKDDINEIKSLLENS